MSALRARMIEDMQVPGLAPGTIRNYVHHIKNFAEYFGTSPDMPFSAGIGSRGFQDASLAAFSIVVYQAHRVVAKNNPHNRA